MRRQTAEPAFERGALAERPEVIGSEQVHIRNHDHQLGYDLNLEIVDAAGGVVFEKRYYLQPGQIESELDALPAGEYEIRATLDNHQAETLQCRIDADPMDTVVAEMGNGVLSLTQGLRG